MENGRVIHHLKVLQSHFGDIKADRQNFGLFPFDHEFQVGDTLVLEEFDGQKFTGAREIRQIKVLLTSKGADSLKPGHCAIGFGIFSWDKLPPPQEGRLMDGMDVYAV
jgi:hypothetical protein